MLGISSELTITKEIISDRNSLKNNLISTELFLTEIFVGESIPRVAFNLFNLANFQQKFSRKLITSSKISIFLLLHFSTF